MYCVVLIGATKDPFAYNIDQNQTVKKDQSGLLSTKSDQEIFSSKCDLEVEMFLPLQSF